MEKRTVLFDLSVKIKNLLNTKPFFCYFLSGVDKRVIYEGDPETRHVPLAAIARKNSMSVSLVINEEGWKKLEIEENRSGLKLKEDVLQHEGLHLAYNHFLTHFENCQYPAIMNIAADLEINQNLENITKYNIGREHLLPQIMEIHLSEISPEEKKAKITEFYETHGMMFMTLDLFGWGAWKFAGTTAYYNKLLEIADQSKNGTLPSTENANLAQMICNMKENQDFADAISEMLNHGTWKEFKDAEGKPTTNEDFIKTKLAKTIKDILDRTNTIGNLPGGFEQFLEDALAEKTKPLDLTRLMSLFIQKAVEYETKLSARKLNKRVPEFKSIKVKPVGTVLYVLDTSGSMSDEDIREGLEKIDNICRNNRLNLDILECDATIYPENIQKIKRFERKKKQNINGRGGTLFDPAVHFVNKYRNNYTAVVYFTDGWVPEPQVKCVLPLLTIVTKNGADIKGLKESGMFGFVIKND